MLLCEGVGGKVVAPRIVQGDYRDEPSQQDRDIRCWPRMITHDEPERPVRLLISCSFLYLAYDLLSRYTSQDLTL